MKTKHSIKHFLSLATSVLHRLDAWLPPAFREPDFSKLAYRWQRIGQSGILQPLPNPHTFPLKKLAAIDKQMHTLVRNTEQFLSGRTANNVLLSGARGTGKSSLVKALLHEYHQRGLRLIEVDKNDLLSLPALLPILVKRSEKFIIFCDDLSFENHEDGYKALKTVLDGGLSMRCENVLVYATSNRRHLMPEYACENIYQQGGDDQIHPQEAIEEKISLSDRFGLWLSFYPFSQQDYLLAVENWLADYDLSLDETSRKAALNWALTRSSRSGRSAWQFVCDWAGRADHERVVD